MQACDICYQATAKSTTLLVEIIEVTGERCRIFVREFTSYMTLQVIDFWVLVIATNCL